MNHFKKLELEDFRRYVKEGKRVTPKIDCKGRENIIFSEDGQTQVGMEKLMSLEDIEERTNCPLKVLYKASRDGFHHKDKGHIVWCLIDFGDYSLRDEKGNRLCEIKDYKTTWWIKEDRSE